MATKDFTESYTNPNVLTRQDANPRDRVILHCDMNGFFASVELLERPELRDVPMAVCGDPDSRHGIILAKNEPAKKYGIVTAETIWQAKRKCPELVCVPPHMQKYRHYSAEINRIYCRYTDMVQPFSIDESWLDVTASRKLFGSGREIADRIRLSVKEELGLTLSAGVSFNKIFAKMGSEYKKPDATTVITRQNFRDLLWPLPIRELFTVGPVTAEKLTKKGIRTIGALAKADSAFPEALLGKSGRILWEYANGLDESPVARFSDREPIKSIGNGTTFRKDLLTRDEILTAVTALSDTVAARLRSCALKARGIKIDITNPDLKTISRQKQLSCPTHLTSELVTAAMEIILASWRIGQPIRLLTVTAIYLCEEGTDEQLNFLAGDPAERERAKRMEQAMDEVRKKYGTAAIGFGAVMQNEIGATVRGDLLESEVIMPQKTDHKG